MKAKADNLYTPKLKCMQPITIIIKFILIYVASG